jgi:enediyne biosynthesis protein E3
MIFSAKGVRRLLFGIHPDEATFAIRGFHLGDDRTRHRLEYIGQTFIRGYNAALSENGPQRLACQLDSVEREFRGFAYEGAAMAVTLLDMLTPWNRGRLAAFIDRFGDKYTHLIHVGSGWALARLRINVDRYLTRFNPLFGWLAIDGYGFHEGYFHSHRCFQEQATPDGLSGYARRAFDQGLGRCLWFVECADPRRITRTISTFPASRQGDLWSGTGLACAYAGGVDCATVEALLATTPPGYRSCLAQGIAFAAKARDLAGNQAEWTNMACEVCCGVSAEAAAVVTDVSLETATDPNHRAHSTDSVIPLYEHWRQLIQAQFNA